MAIEPRVTSAGIVIESETIKQARVTSTGIQIEYETTKTGSKSAYLEAPSPSASGSKTAYLTGVGGASSSVHTYVGGISISNSNRPAYTYGYSTSSDSNTAYLAGCPSFEIEWVAVGIPAFGTAATSSINAYLDSLLPERSSIHAFILPNAVASGSKHAYSNSSSTKSSLAHSYTSGIEQSISNKQAYLSGIAQTTSSKASYTKGSSSVTSSKHAYLGGQVRSSTQAYILGAGGNSVHAYLRGTDIYPIIEDFETGGISDKWTEGVYPIEYNSTAAYAGNYGMAMNIDPFGDSVQTTTFSAHTEQSFTMQIMLHDWVAKAFNYSADVVEYDLVGEGYFGPRLFLDIHTDGKTYVMFTPKYQLESNSIEIQQDTWYKIQFQRGTDWGELIINDILKWRTTENSWDGGLLQSIRIRQVVPTSGYIYIDNITALDTAKQTEGEPSVDTKSNKSAYTYGNMVHAPAYLCGISLEEKDNAPAYTLGAPEVNSTKSSCLYGQNVKTGYKLAYIMGYNTSISNKASYLFGVVATNSSTHAYTPGAQGNVDSNKHAYIGSLTYRSSKSAYIGESLPGAAMTQPYITLADSTGTTVCNFRVIHEGYTDGELEKAGSVEPTIGGGVDVSMGAVRKKWEPIIKVYGTNSTVDEAGYGTRTALEWFFNLNNPNGTPSNVISMTDHHGSTHSIFLIDTLQANLLTTLVEGSGAVFHVKVRMIEAN